MFEDYLGDAVRLVPVVVAVGTLVISALALCVGVVIEVIKDLPRLKRLPTNLVVIVVAAAVCMVAAVVAAWLFQYELGAVEYILALCLAFPVTLVATNGWAFLRELKKRIWHK